MRWRQQEWYYKNISPRTSRPLPKSERSIREELSLCIYFSIFTTKNDDYCSRTLSECLQLYYLPLQHHYSAKTDCA